MNKIIFINRYFYPDLSATSQMLTDLAFALADDGKNVWVITSRQTYEAAEAGLAQQQCYAGVEIRRVWTTRFGRMNLVGRALDYVSFYVASLWTLLRILRPGDVVVAKTDPPLISVIGWIAAKVKGAKLINWLQDVFPEVAVALGILRQRSLVAPIRWARNLSLRGAAMNVVLGEQMRERICEQGVERARTTIIHNWADASQIKPISRASNALREEWKLRDKFVVGYSGNMGRAHEFDTVIDAMKRLQHDQDIVFLFIGGGAGRKKLAAALAALRLDNYLFLPYQPRERLCQSLSVPDVHLASLQPRLEGLIVPSKIYGVAAAGRPLIFIGDPKGEIGRMISQFEFGFAIPVGAGEELAQLIIKLKRDPGMIERIGNNGRRAVLENFDKSHAIDAWTSLVENI